MIYRKGLYTSNLFSLPRDGKTAAAIGGPTNKYHDGCEEEVGSDFPHGSGAPSHDLIIVVLYLYRSK